MPEHQNPYPPQMDLYRLEVIERWKESAEPRLAAAEKGIAVMEERLSAMQADVRDIARSMGRLVAVGIGVITVTFAALIAALIDMAGRV